MIRALALLAICNVVVAGCAGPIKSKPNAYSYLGRIGSKGEDVVVEPRSRNVNDREQSVAGAQASVDPKYRQLAPVIYDLLPSTKTVRYQRYTVNLEREGEVSLRSYVTELQETDCVRVWILGPGVSPVYLYAPDQAEIERADGCK
jgi:hypothetical protein